jgi:hypothetical protein
LVKEVDKNKVISTNLRKMIKYDLGMKMILVSKKSAEREDMERSAGERALLKERYRAMGDQQRELQKALTDLGLGEFIITNEDREFLANQELKDMPTEEELEGYERTRDFDEQGEQPVNDNGVPMEVDDGNYASRSVLDYNEYTTQDGFPDSNED